MAPRKGALVEVKSAFSILKNKRILITGNTGFKGTWLTIWLNQIGAQVFGLSKDIPFQPSYFESLGLEKMQTHAWGDIGQLSDVSEVFQKVQPEAVIHMAAQPLVRYSYDQPVETFRTNVLGTVHVLEAIRQTASVQSVVMVTTDKVYRNTEQTEGYREEDRLGGHDPYSGSKASCELAIESYFLSYFKARPRFSVSVARAGNVIGGGDYSQDRLIPDAVRAWVGNRPMIVRNPSSVRPWQHVLEPLSGYLQLVAQGFSTSEKVHGQAFNFGPRVEAGGTVQEIADVFRKRWSGFQVDLRPEDGTLKKETTLLRLNFEKALKVLGWQPRLSIQEALEWTAEIYEQFHSRPDQTLEKMKEQIVRYESKIH